MCYHLLSRGGGRMIKITPVYISPQGGSITCLNVKNKRIFQLCSTYKDRIKHFTKLEEVILKSGTNHSENEKIVNHLN